MTHPIQITRTITFSDQQLCDILTTAFEGGMPWCKSYEIAEAPNALLVYAFKADDDEPTYCGYMAPVFGGRLSLRPHDEDILPVYNLTLQRLKDALETYLSKPEQTWIVEGDTDGDSICCDIDANDASSIIEIAIFGEEVYA